MQPITPAYTLCKGVLLAAALFLVGLQDAGATDAPIDAAAAAPTDPALEAALKDLDRAERLYGPESRGTARELAELALEYMKRREPGMAEPLYLRALSIYEATPPDDLIELSNVFNGLTVILLGRNEYANARPYAQRALEIVDAYYGKFDPEHRSLPAYLYNLAVVYALTDETARAEPLVARALKISERVNGPDYPATIKYRNELASLQRELASDELAPDDPVAAPPVHDSVAPPAPIATMGGGGPADGGESAGPVEVECPPGLTLENSGELERSGEMIISYDPVSGNILCALPAGRSPVSSSAIATQAQSGSGGDLGNDSECVALKNRTLVNNCSYAVDVGFCVVNPQQTKNFFDSSEAFRCPNGGLSVILPGKGEGNILNGEVHWFACDIKYRGTGGWKYLPEKGGYWGHCR